VIKIAIQSEDILIHAISHKIRREILELLDNSPKSFSEVLNYFDLSTGKLDYHLKQIKGFIFKNETNNYELTSLGQKALEILRIIKKEVGFEEQPYLKEAFISQKSSSSSIFSQGVNLGIGGLVFITAITIFLLIVFLNVADAPFFIWPIIITMFLGELYALIWLIRLRKHGPAFIERLNKHLKEENSN